MIEGQFQVGEFVVDFASGAVTPVDANMSSVVESRLEPKSCALLAYLCEHSSEVVSKDRLFKQVWPDTVVSDDALLRCVSQIRKAFSDSAKTPSYIETVPKKGYRLIADVQKQLEVPTANRPTVAVNSNLSRASDPANQKTVDLSKVKLRTTAVGFIFVIAGIWLTQDNLPSNDADKEYDTMLQRADNYYHQIRRTDNEMAISLYEQTMSLKPTNASAQAGLANALVQKTLRWSGAENSYETLGDAVKAGVFERPDARPAIERALALAERAVRLEPENVRARKALGFVLTALGRYDDAMEHYNKALDVDKHAWQVLINAGEIASIQGNDEQALVLFEQAFEAMTVKYDDEIAQIRPWYADMGAAIGNRYLAKGETDSAEIWYRRVLGHAPLHEGATLSLAQLLAEAGDASQAKRLCNSLNERTGSGHECSYD